MLGVPKPTSPYTSVSSLEQLNAVNNPSVVHYTSNVVTGHSDYGIVVTWVFGSNWHNLLQMELTYNNAIYVRMKWNYQNPAYTWSDWKEI